MSEVTTERGGEHERCKHSSDSFRSSCDAAREDKPHSAKPARSTAFSVIDQPAAPGTQRSIGVTCGSVSVHCASARDRCHMSSVFEIPVKKIDGQLSTLD